MYNYKDVDFWIKQFEGGKLGLQGANFTRLLVDDLRLRAVLRLRYLTERLPVGLRECLGEILVEYEAGDEEIGGDALVDVGVVAEKGAHGAVLLVDKRPVCVAAAAVYKQCARARQYSE